MGLADYLNSIQAAQAAARAQLDKIDPNQNLSAEMLAQFKDPSYQQTDDYGNYINQGVTNQTNEWMPYYSAGDTDPTTGEGYGVQTGYERDVGNKQYVYDFNGNLIGIGNKSGGIGDFIKQVAPIALSAGLGGAAGIGSALGATGAAAPIVGGAALGAGTAALTGGNTLTGALMGGLGGAGGAQIGDTGVTVGQVNTAANVAKNLESGNLLGAATGVSNLAGTGNTQIGDTGVSVNNALNAANLINAVNTGNIGGALSSATKLASSGSSPLNAAPIDQNASPTLNTGLSTDVPVPGTGGLPADASSTQASSNVPSGLNLAANNTGTVSDTGSGIGPVSISGFPIFADSKNANTVKPPFGYDLMPMALNDKSLRPDGAYYDTTQNAWFMPNNDVKNLQNQLSNSNVNTNLNSEQNSTDSSGSENTTSGLTTSDVNDSIKQGTSGLATTQDVQNAIDNIKIPAGLTKDDVSSIVNTALASNPSLTVDQVQSMIDKLPASPTTSDIQNLISQGTSGLATNSALDTLSSTVASNQAANQSAIDAASKSISDVSTNLGNQISGVQSSLQSQLGDATSSLNQRIDQLVTSGMNAQDATNQAISELSSGQQASQQQISNVQSGLDVLGKNVASDQAQTQSQLAGMSAQEQSDVANLTQQGVSLQDAINKVSEQSSTQNAAVEGQISDLSKNLTSGLSANSQQINDVQSNLESQLNAQGKSLMDALTAQGEDYNTALNTAIDQQNKNFADYQNQTSGQIAGVQSGLDVLGKDVAANQASTNQSIADVNTAVSNLDTKTQEEYNSLTDAQKAEAAQEAQNTGDLQKAISDTAANAAAATAALAASTAAQNKSLSNQLSNMQAAQNLANQKPLDSSAQLLTSTDTGSKGFKLAQLHQLFNSLTPEMKSVLSEKGITPPAEEPMPETQAATGGLISDETQKVLDSLNPKFISAPTHLTSSMPQQQESRLGALRHIPQGVLKGSTLSNRMSHGGLPHKYAEAAPEGHNPEFITGLTGYYAQGGGTGQSDDIPAMLHDGDYVMDADTVAALGDGSSKAGAEVLEKMRKQIPHHDRAEGSAVPAKIADGEYVFPASFVTAIGGGSNKVGAERLNEMREKIRAHKRSAPTSKIPPKAKSPLDYLKMAKG